MRAHILRDFLALTLDNTLPVVGTASRQREDGHNTGRDDDNQNDSHNKNQRTLKHVFILPYQPHSVRRGHPKLIAL